MATNPYESPKTEGRPPEVKSRQFQPTVFGCLAVVGIVAVVIALFLPNVRFPREASRRSMCTNNLKQIGLALHNYADEYGAFPPAYTVDADGKPLHSWRTLILPYVEQRSLYEKIDFTKPWDDPANKEAFDTAINVYRCPSVSCPKTHTTYLAIVVPGSCFRPVESRKYSEITDGTETLMVMEVEAKSAVHWMSPQDANDRDVCELATKDNKPHAGGAHVLFADGHIRFLSGATKPEVIRALITIDADDQAIAHHDD